MAELVLVEQIKPGDWVVLPRGAEREVVTVTEYEDGTFVVVYATGETSRPLRDRDGDTHGSHPEPVLAQLIGKPAGETWPIARRAA